jgi:hypothetical protein
MGQDSKACASVDLVTCLRRNRRATGVADYVVAQRRKRAIKVRPALHVLPEMIVFRAFILPLLLFMPPPWLSPLLLAELFEMCSWSDSRCRCCKSPTMPVLPPLSEFPETVLFMTVNVEEL